MVVVLGRSGGLGLLGNEGVGGWEECFGWKQAGAAATTHAGTTGGMGGGGDGERVDRCKLLSSSRHVPLQNRVKLFDEQLNALPC